jgi:hypothetical protein
LELGRVADLAVLSDDVFTIAEERLRGVQSLLTMVDGRIVHASGNLGRFAPAPIPMGETWWPIAARGEPVEMRVETSATGCECGAV